MGGGGGGGGGAFVMPLFYLYKLGSQIRNNSCLYTILAFKEHNRIVCPIYCSNHTSRGASYWLFQDGFLSSFGMC